jgi:hypothetical protein
MKLVRLPRVGGDEVLVNPDVIIQAEEFLRDSGSTTVSLTLLDAKGLNINCTAKQLIDLIQSTPEI